VSYNIVNISKIGTMPQLEYKGLGIGRGVAKGPAHLMRDIEDNQSVGKILILDYPSAAYSWAIKRSLGFVAEQGGIGSHGSTLALELNIPAIVGVLKATKILKNGDLLEIDADKGVVRRL
jgi:pyruvate,water dikinase